MPAVSSLLVSMWHLCRLCICRCQFCPQTPLCWALRYHSPGTSLPTACGQELQLWAGGSRRQGRVFGVSRLETETLCVCVCVHPSPPLLSSVRQTCIVMLLITLRGLNVDKHKTRLLKSLTIIMQHFSDYSPRDALHKANKAHAGGLLLPWQRTTGHPVCEMHEHLRINLF